MDFVNIMLDVNNDFVSNGMPFLKKLNIFMDNIVFFCLFYCLIIKNQIKKIYIILIVI